MVVRVSLRQVIEQLKKAQLLSPEGADEVRQVLTASAQTQTVPWVVNILISLGAWFTTLLLTVYTLISLNSESPVFVVISGGVLVIMAIALNDLSRENLFLNQMALACSLTGQTLLVVGLSIMEIPVVPVVVFTIVLAISLFFIYRHSIHRFLTVLITFGASLFLFFELQLFQWLPLLTFIAAGGVLWCWLEETPCLIRFPEFQRPLGYGLVVVLLGLLSPTSLPLLGDFLPMSWVSLAIGLPIFLLIVAHHHLRLYDIAITSATGVLIFAGIVLISGLLYQAPGVITAVIVMLLGFQRSNWLLMGLAFIFFVLFYISYYHSLNITLLMKSITLISTGVSLLGLRFWLKHLYARTSHLPVYKEQPN